jgi:hypothetical protein
MNIYQHVKLITESSFDVSLVESEKDKSLYIAGIFSTAETENANGRKYRKSTLERETNRISEEYLKINRPFFGELGHPSTPEPNLDRIAIRTTALEWKGDNLFGKAKVLETRMGKEAQILLKEGPVGISSRGLGQVDEDKYVKDESYRLLAYDLVLSPSNGPSWVKGIYEAQDFVIYNSSFVNTPLTPEIDEAKLQLQLKEAREKYFRTLIDFLDSIKEGCGPKKKRKGKQL